MHFKCGNLISFGQSLSRSKCTMGQRRVLLMVGYIRKFLYNSVGPSPRLMKLSCSSFWTHCRVKPHQVSFFVYMALHVLFRHSRLFGDPTYDPFASSPFDRSLPSWSLANWFVDMSMLSVGESYIRSIGM